MTYKCMFFLGQDFFRNLPHWIQQHTAMNDAGNFLIETCDEIVSRDLKQQLLLLNGRWRELFMEVKQVCVSNPRPLQVRVLSKWQAVCWQVFYWTYQAGIQTCLKLCVTASHSVFAVYDGGTFTECSIWLRIILTYGACIGRGIYFSNPGSPLLASSFSFLLSK